MQQSEQPQKRQALTELYLSPLALAPSQYGGLVYREMIAVDANVLFRSTADPDVAVILVSRIAAVVYTGRTLTPASLQDGTRRLVHETVTIGRLFHGGSEGSIRPRIWTSQYTQGDLVLVFKNEIMEWWAHLTQSEQLTILESFDDQVSRDL